LVSPVWYAPASVVITQRPSAARFRPFLAVSFEETWSADSEQTANTRMTCGAQSGRPNAPSCRSLFPDADAVNPHTDRAELPRDRGRWVAQRWSVQPPNNLLHHPRSTHAADGLGRVWLLFGAGRALEDLDDHPEVVVGGEVGELEAAEGAAEHLPVSRHP
jgi:hypothetical protein